MEPFYVINVGRQLGSCGKDIAEALAARLGITAYDKKLIDIAAQESGIGKEFFEHADEKNTRNIFRIFFGAREGGGISDYAFNGCCLNDNELFKIQSDVIRKIAARESCIFVGRCADYILRDHVRCLNLFITANMDHRIACVATREKVSEEKAREIIEKGDRCRASYYNYYSNRTWGAADTYHLCVNSSVLGVEGTADMLLDFAKRKLSIEL